MVTGLRRSYSTAAVACEKAGSRGGGALSRVEGFRV